MQKLLVIVGPTGTGKTSLGIALAKKFDGEIVSADSRQVYKGMDIGTGKEGKNDSIPIHLYDVVDPDEKFSLADYQLLTLEKIKEIHSRGRLPILIGGTGLYIQAVTEGLKIPKVPPNEELRAKLEKMSLDHLLEELAKVDPKTFERVDKNNPRRVIRALEVFYQTGKPFSELQEKFKVDFDILKIGLTGERESLYAKIDQRIESWFEQGFVSEVKNLAEKYEPTLPSMSSLGYRQVKMHLDKKQTLEEAKQRIKFDHHDYVRRQMTWFKRDKSIFWFNFNLENLSDQVSSAVAEWLADQVVSDA